jgi:virulence factor Mce-like protein
MHGPRVNPVISGLATIVVVVVVFTAVIVSGIPGGPQLPIIGSHDTLIKAMLPDADNLAPHASVEIAGVKIGEVRNVDGQGNQAVVTMDIQPGNTDIHSDATVQLRPHGLFGPKFVQINPGTASAPVLHDGDTIPGTNASLPVDLDQVLHTLQAPERAQLQTVVVELGKAAEGRGDDVNHMLAAARTLTQVLDSPVQSLDAVAPNLSNMLVQNEAFNASFAQAPLDQLIANNNRALAVLAANTDHIKSILDHANSTLINLDAALNGQVGNLRTAIETAPALIDQFDRFNDLASLFGANFTGKDPTSPGDITQGIIGAIENVRSAFSSYTPCNPSTTPGCPADGQAHYVRVQTFNVTPNLAAPSQLCTTLPNPGPLNVPGVGTITIPSLPGCPAAAAGAHGASATVIPVASQSSWGSSADPSSLTALAGT